MRSECEQCGDQMVKLITTRRHSGLRYQVNHEGLSL